MKKQQKIKREFINPVFKDKVVVLKTSEETNGEFSLGELEVSPGGGNFMHTHSAFEETFTAVKGTLGVAIRTKRYYLNPGESVTIPRNTPHHFFNDGLNPIVCHVRFVPGHEGFQKGLAIAYGLARDKKTDNSGKPKSLSHLALIMDMTDTKPTGLLNILFPLFKWMARRAKKNGTEKALLQQYYYEHE